MAVSETMNCAASSCDTRVILDDQLVAVAEIEHGVVAALLEGIDDVLRRGKAEVTQVDAVVGLQDR